jgi:UDP-N-acetylmuramyl tripeptide synthase
MHIPSKILVTLMGKSVRAATRLRGGGSAYPGLFVERIDPNFIKSTLKQLPMGVIVVSGTNGKTTTTKMVVELLEGQGLQVFTNRTGSNFTRGVAAALLGDMTVTGKLTADIAVLELDEAHAVQFVKSVAPRYSLLLNVMRDQLDRFGEIDYTTNLLRAVAEHTSDIVVLNREDERVASIADSLDNQQVYFFGLDKKLLSHFPSDDALHGAFTTKQSNLSADVVLTRFDDESASFTINGKPFNTTLKLRGAYNIFNAAAALALVTAVMGNRLDQTKLITSLRDVEPAFGRGETIMVNGQPLELVLVKNPSGFRLGLQSFNPKDWATMIAINDNYADGRDMSWLWDVDFSSLAEEKVAEVSGVRAYDMALRLEYDEVQIGHVEPDLPIALEHFLAKNNHQPKRIYCTYTAMLAIRKDLSKITNVEVIS